MKTISKQLEDLCGLVTLSGSIWEYIYYFKFYHSENGPKNKMGDFSEFCITVPKNWSRKSVGLNFSGLILFMDTYWW